MSKKGYQGFGSFHSDNVEELVRLSDEEFDSRCPPLPFEHPISEYLSRTEKSETDDKSSENIQVLGHAARKHFLIDFNSWTFLNHGAFGAVSRYAYEVAALWRERCEHQPLRFLDREMLPHQIRVLREMAKLVHARPEDMVLLQNATTGLNVLLRSLVRSCNDIVYMPDIGYGSTKKIAKAACENVGGASLVLGKVPLPISSEDELFQAIIDGIPEGCTVAILDWITSNTALVLPIKALVQELKSRGIKVIVDGAHAIGMLPVNFEALRSAGIQYFTGNCHKWLCGPRGTAILWVAPEKKEEILPAILSHGSGCGFTSDFAWDGNRDYAGTLALSAAIEFHKTVGLDRIMEHMQSVLHDAVKMLTAAWKSGTLAPLTMCPPGMALVQLPAYPQKHDKWEAHGNGQATSADAKHVQDFLFQSGVEVPVKCISGKLYIRLSVHIYNALEDYSLLDSAIEAFLSQPVSAVVNGVTLDK